MNAMTKIYCAPMEGITGYIYRNALDEYFPYQDRYFTPFIATNHNKLFTSRELNDILPANNMPGNIVPQLLSNNAEDFIRTAKELKEYGYTEININLGCPSPTVVTKKKGAGFLAFPDELDEFLDRIYEAADKEDISISIKTRTGMTSPDEFAEILEIYNRYPVSELIIHPRVQADLYNNTPDYNVFEYALKHSNAPVCYNGDIFTKADYDRLTQRFPERGSVMLGRGLLRNPALAGEIKAGIRPDKAVIKKFHDCIYREYCKIMPGDRNVLFKMKELWYYMIQSFENGERYYKKIRKTQRKCDYESIVNELFTKC
ncbi:MAG: tRNA-dihydrouridine synthase family protein [Clostridia bacterium]|nr:tRNA-dihydrouridine synthase family protein [Clostridia bacterium]